jgi:K(+)-stimulated pyrophosphate-energized sodium pump
VLSASRAACHWFPLRHERAGGGPGWFGACSALLGPFFNNTGTAFDNAKKTIENLEYSRGTPEHIAAVIGDTVGDSLKDVAGPSTLIFMK